MLNTGRGNFADRLQDKIDLMNNPTVMGLDPLVEYLPEEIKNKFHLSEWNKWNDLNKINKINHLNKFDNLNILNKSESAVSDSGDFSHNNTNFNIRDKYFEIASEAILEFNIKLIDAVKDIVPAIKPQIAYYEILGPHGIKAYQETINYGKTQGMIVIADAKRNDIGSTAAMYSSAFLGRTQTPFSIDDKQMNLPAFDADALTVNAYTGIDGIKPFIEDCKKHDKGIFILVRTSNPSAGDFQDLTLKDGSKLYEKFAEKVEEWGCDLIGKSGFSSVGAVVGATWPEQAAKLREIMPHAFILVPGYGAQGGTGKTAAASFNREGKGAVVNASRSLMLAYRQEKYMHSDFQRATREEAINMREDLNFYIR